MKNESPVSSVRQDLESLVRDLATLKDDLQVQAHLATMELRDRWKRLDQQHQELHGKVHAASPERDASVGELQRSVADLRREVRLLRVDSGVDAEC